MPSPCARVRAPAVKPRKKSQEREKARVKPDSVIGAQGGPTHRKMLAASRRMDLRRLSRLIALLAWCAAVGIAWSRFDPGSQLVSGWNSDGAIPVLMSNAEGFTPFDLYYWGQDRIDFVEEALKKH